MHDHVVLHLSFPLHLPLAQPVDPLLVVLQEQLLGLLQAGRALLAGAVGVDHVEIVVVLHQQRLEILEAAFGRTVVEGVHQQAEGLLLVVDDAVLVLVVLQFLVGQVREAVEVLVTDALPLLREQQLFLRDDLFSDAGGLRLDLKIGDIAGVGGALQGDELRDAAADGEDHFGVGDDQEEQQHAEGQQVDVAVALEVQQEAGVARRGVHQQVEQGERGRGDSLALPGKAGALFLFALNVLRTHLIITHPCEGRACGHPMLHLIDDFLSSLLIK